MWTLDKPTAFLSAAILAVSWMEVLFKHLVKSSHMVCSCRQVLRCNYLMIGIDGSVAENGSDWFCYHTSSACIFPVGFCEINNIELTPPRGRWRHVSPEFGCFSGNRRRGFFGEIFHLGNCGGQSNIDSPLKGCSARLVSL